MTALVACFGLLPAAMSTGIGCDSQKPFAIVIVGGLASRLLLSVFLAPVLYAVVAREGDTLRV
ncbi:MAG TPA: efflux RND transporter permease subunit [Bryobacteraceae bacterium]|nr:efflux RND transporter permease subunit [Bryobacteraceae bacterium]